METVKRVSHIKVVRLQNVDDIVALQLRSEEN